MPKLRIVSAGPFESARITLDGVEVPRVVKCTIVIDPNDRMRCTHALLEIINPEIEIETDDVAGDALPSSHGTPPTEPGEPPTSRR